MKLFQFGSKAAPFAAKAEKPVLSPIANPAASSAPRLHRRNLVLGTGVAGAAAVAAYALPRTGSVVAPAPLAAAALPEQGDGYQVTPHVLRYYETAKV